jgi:glutamyl-tRNA synthetase
MSVITRFAPSPTGYLHIGGARTALFNYLFAKRNKGKFLLRVEDTDEKRSTQEAIKAIIEGLQWLGLDHDGYVLQSENFLRHQEIAKNLLEKEQAYLCYTSAEELEEMRKSAEKKGEVFRFQSSWRNKAMSQTSSVKPVIRIKAPISGETEINDLVQGKVKVQNSELDDLVMLRGDGTATYMLAVVVDDHDMGVTHIIRGDDHFTNAFRQKIIYQAMNWAVPEFAHIPLIHGSDGAKLSKRHGATSVIEYKNFGYLPEALRNYLLRLGWSHQDAEIISDQQANEWFNLEKIGKSPARFDFDKLNYLNKHYIKQKNQDELFDLLLPFFDQEISFEEKERIKKVISFLKERSATMLELSNLAKIYFNNFQSSLDEESQKILSEKKHLLIEIKNILDILKVWNHDDIKNAFNQFALEKNLKIKDFGPLIRVVLTFSSSSAGGIFDIVEFLGKQEVSRRINLFLS